MQELQRNGERSGKELSPNPKVIKALEGVISEPITTISQKPGFEGSIVNVRLVEEGAGLLGLSDLADNKEWSGIFNHILLTARYSTHLLSELSQQGYHVDPQRVLNGMLASHNGRRQWDEARWYPHAVQNATEKTSMSNETLGMHIVQGKIADNAFDLVVALGHNVEGFSVDPAIYDSLDYKIAIYADHRTSQSYEKLHTRMGEFLLGNFFDRSSITDEVRQNIYEGMQAIIELRRGHTLGKHPIEISLDMADKIAEEMGTAPKSPRILRRDLMALVLQDADTEALLLDNGIDVELNDIVEMPTWEDELRKLYVQAAKDGLSHFFNQGGEIANPASWWEKYALELHSQNPSK